MKRFLALILVFFVSGSVVYFFIVRPPDGDLLNFVPANSVAVVDWDSPALAYTDFISTPLGKTLKDIDWPLIIKASGLTQPHVTLAGKVVNSWLLFSRSKVFKEILGTRSVLALLSKDEGELNPAAGRQSGSQGALSASLLSFPEKNLVFLNRTGRKTALLHSLFAGYSGIQQLPDIQYQGFTIHGYLLENGYSVYFTTRKDLLIAALDPAPLKQCLNLLLEQILQKDRGMTTNPQYAGLKKQARGLDNFFFYLDINRLKSELQEIVSQLPSDSAETAPAAWFSEQGVQQAAFYHQPFQRIHQFTSIVRFDESALPAFQKSVYTRPPVENRKLGRMPANLLAYFWSNWFDLPSWWQMTNARASDEDAFRIDQFAAAILKYTGVPVEEFLALFGHQIGLNVKEIKTSGFLPVPRICFCIEVTDREKVGTMLEKYLDGLPLHRKMAAGVSVVSVMAAGGLMQPSYALLEDFLILADGRDQIEDILLPGRAMLVNDPDFIEVDMGLQQLNNMVFFARTAELLEGLKELAAWVGTIIAVRDEQAGARSKILLDGAVIPLLDSLTMIKAEAMRGYTGDGEIVVQTSELMADKKQPGK